ncbi:aldehyde dehydrogenase family protein [Amycolatopsis saalfeldensis]|uniref:aldehyde dehydrogenase (NAD(+)) n=1 Tax=Amycolatopsis saalfeldensis TaxID=394193 RepID=A0A1H8U125_9PSEU|nr:aldehyde dehydrogenase family protein [Amycolatopsis saalfeldensis]SEO96871.1 aldehyde dehydrogenase (NAD+) [Amycolatopsis saalfeldensis]
MRDRDKIYVDGEWVAPQSGIALVVENPATEERLARVPVGTGTDVRKAISAARRAFPGWSATPVPVRAGVLREIARGLAERADELAATVTAEMGCPIRTSQKIQVGLPQLIAGQCADVLEAYPFSENIGNSLVVREAAGVVGAITPWNYPLHQIVSKVLPALAAGCTVVLKPSELAPLTAYLFVEILDRAGVPAGVVNLVPGHGKVVGTALATDPGLDVVSFTGSVAAGKQVARAAAGTLARVTLELGGKSANVLLADADVAKAVKVGVANAFLNAGQTCTAWSRMLVPDEIHDDVVELAAQAAAGYQPGDPADPATRLGPLVSAAQREKVRGFIRTGVAEGARLAAGGAGQPDGIDRGHYVNATILADVKPDSTVAQEEIFGPVLSILRYSDECEALEIANNSKYGLAGAVWSADEERAMAFARRLRTGAVDINGGRFNPLAPFGGYKQSGIGRELGVHGLAEFLEAKAIQL